MLRIENLCTLSNLSIDCVETADSAGIPELPMVIPMTDNADGTYYAEYTLSSGGDINLSVTLQGFIASHSNLYSMAGYYT